MKSAAKPVFDKLWQILKRPVLLDESGEAKPDIFTARFVSDFLEVLGMNNETHVVLYAQNSVLSYLIMLAQRE
jgi:hypothetical protein